MTPSLGPVRGIVSSSGSLTAATSYDAWGNPETPGGLSSSAPFGYAGGYTGPTGLIYLINRYYDPATGQFISVDPELALTQAPYAGGNPVTNTGTSGLTLESHHRGPKKPGGFQVQTCIQTWAIFLRGQWYAQAIFRPDKNIIETGAKAIGLEVCDAHRKRCHHNAEEVVQPRGQWVTQCNKVVCYNNPPWLVTPSAVFFTGSNWVYAWVSGAWAKSRSGGKSKPVTLRDKWIKTCSHACN